MERKFVLATDTGADLPDQYYGEHQIERIPLGFQMNGVSYSGDVGEEMNVKTFYEALRGGSMPTTFQITPEQARKHLQPIAASGRDILVLSFSSGLSGTINSYTLVARELTQEYPERKILVVDTLCASMGQGLIVDYAVKKADTGASIEDTRDYLENLKLHICHYFTVEDLFHLKRGGRVSAATAVVGSMLKIKPVLHVDNDGHLISIGKAMGRKKSISALVDHMKELQTLEQDDPIFISHGDCQGDVDYLITLLKETFGERKIVVNEIGAVIGTHSGAGTLALFFRGKRR